MIFVAMLAVVTTFVAAPLYGRAGPAPSSERRALEARRDVLLATLRELEIDRATGALDEADYARSRSGTEAEAAAVLRQLSQAPD